MPPKRHRAGAVPDMTPVNSFYFVWRAIGARMPHTRASAAAPAVKRRRVVWPFQVVAKTLRFPMVFDGNCSAVLNSHYCCNATRALSGTDVRRRAATLGAYKNPTMVESVPDPCAPLQRTAEGRLTRAPSNSVHTVIPSQTLQKALILQ